MKNHIALVIVALAPILIAPTAAAHPGAQVVENPVSGARCYLYTNDGAQELWIETNGVTTGGAPSNLGEVNHVLDLAGQPPGAGSGLQRAAFVHQGVLTSADTRAEPQTWIDACAVP